VAVKPTKLHNPRKADAQARWPVTSEQILRTYFHAKDENRPYLLDDVFSTDARLGIRNRSEQISFPAVTVGLAGIADVLVRRFNQTYENSYSFYLARPTSKKGAFSCDWLVAMTEKESKAVRVGCGQYEWALQRNPELHVTEPSSSVPQAPVR
jgi:hypothetical protein